MDWFWHVLVVCVVVIPVTIMWVAIVIEILRRHDLNAFQRVCWLLVILMLPILGSFTYVIVTLVRAGSKRAEPAVPRAAPANPRTVSDLTELDRLRRTGALTDAEFEAGKRQILEGTGGRHAAEGVGS